jgi:hypothetical protein
MDFWRTLRRGILVLGIPALIIWLGGTSISHISELYDGLCPGQSPNNAILLYDGNRNGYCTGIGDELSLLGFIMAIAVLAVMATLVLWWQYRDEQ